nr:hypothetical protein [Candidatus Sigynarchaeota archaeon]
MTVVDSMPLAWDVMLSIVSGFLFSSFQPLLKHGLKKDMKDIYFFVLGLIFNQMVIVAVSVWCWVAVDQNWLMLYWAAPSELGNKVFFIYALFPLFYIVPYELNRILYRKNISRHVLFAVTTAWILFTLIVLPDFVTLFKANDTVMHGIDYPAQYLWNLTQFPAGNAVWFFPIDYGTFFLLFFYIIVFFMVSFEAIAIIISCKNFFKPKKQGGAA